jgi:ankyrin repeat protein
VRLLLARLTDAQVAHANRYGATALIMAARRGQVEILRLLLARMPPMRR